MARHQVFYGRHTVQIDSIPDPGCPPLGLKIDTMRGTNNPAATAHRNRLNNGDMELGPLGLRDPHLCLEAVEALPQVGEDFLIGSSARHSQQTVTGFMDSVWHIPQSSNRAQLNAQILTPSKCPNDMATVYH